MKDFNDFRKSLTDKDFKEIYDEANRQVELEKEQQADNSGIQLGNEVVSMSIGVNLVLLEKYHVWLNS